MTDTSVSIRNRANAQHSTGPRTPEGKQRSAANARKHGFTGRTLIVYDDQIEEHERFLDDWQNELKPAGAAEQELFGQVLVAAWNLRRISRAEAGLMQDSFIDPLANLDDDGIRKKLSLYSIYQSRNQRDFHKAMGELRKLQEERLFRDEQPASPLASSLPRTHVVRQRVAADKRTQNALQQAQVRTALDEMFRQQLAKPDPEDRRSLESEGTIEPSSEVVTPNLPPETLPTLK